MRKSVKGFSHHFDALGGITVVHWGPQPEDNFIFVKKADGTEKTSPCTPLATGKYPTKGQPTDLSISMYGLDCSPAGTEELLTSQAWDPEGEKTGLWHQVKLFVSDRLNIK